MSREFEHKLATLVSKIMLTVVALAGVFGVGILLWLDHWGIGLGWILFTGWAAWLFSLDIREGRL